MPLLGSVYNERFRGLLRQAKYLKHGNLPSATIPMHDSHLLPGIPVDRRFRYNTCSVISIFESKRSPDHVKIIRRPT